VLILVRHGQSEANAAGLLLGRADSELTELGRLQASRIGQALARSVRHFSGGDDDGPDQAFPNRRWRSV
jgi:broad specificity phosphatase PhoE